MADGYLRLRFHDDADGTGKLWARAEADGFSGEGAAYFSVEELEDFAKALAVFPMPPEDPRRSITGGFGNMENPGTVDQEHLGISVYPADVKRGYIGVQVRMATEIWPGTRPESTKLQWLKLSRPTRPFPNSVQICWPS